MHIRAAPCVSMGRAEVCVLLLESGFLADLTSQTRPTGFGYAQEQEKPCIKDIEECSSPESYKNTREKRTE